METALAHITHIAQPVNSIMTTGGRYPCFIFDQLDLITDIKHISALLTLVSCRLENPTGGTASHDDDPRTIVAADFGSVSDINGTLVAELKGEFLRVPNM